MAIYAQEHIQMILILAQFLFNLLTVGICVLSNVNEATRLVRFRESSIIEKYKRIYGI